MNTCSNPQVKLRNYNKMNTNFGDDNGDDGDAAVNDGDDAQASKDFSGGGEDRCPSTSSSSRVLVSTNVKTMICLHGVKLFDEAVLMVHGMAGRYGQVPAVQMPVKTSVASFLDWFSLRCKNKCN
jgi:hypothetical protein